VVPGASAFFELVSATTTDFDVNLAPITGDITALKKGYYSVQWEVDGMLTDVIFPPPSWSFGIYINGLLVASSTSGSTTLSLEDVVTNNSGSSIFLLNAGDVVSLKNISLNAVSLVSNPVGTAQPVASARLNIILLTDLSMK
jgi:hypothetical protein